MVLVLWNLMGTMAPSVIIYVYSGDSEVEEKSGHNENPFNLIKTFDELEEHEKTEVIHSASMRKKPFFQKNFQ